MQNAYLKFQKCAQMHWILNVLNFNVYFLRAILEYWCFTFSIQRWQICINWFLMLRWWNWNQPVNKTSMHARRTSMVGLRHNHFCFFGAFKQRTWFICRQKFFNNLYGTHLESNFLQQPLSSLWLCKLVESKHYDHTLGVCLKTYRAALLSTTHQGSYLFREHSN